MKKVLILGSTGSIGTQALEVIGRSDELQAVGLAAGSRWELTVEQAREHGVPTIALADADAAERARGAWSGRVLAGEEGVRELIAGTEPDLVLNAIVGAAGLGSTIVALSEGIDVALANKESLVLGGELVMALAEATGARLLPVDSEHSALFQLIERRGAGDGRAAGADRLRRAFPRPRRPLRGQRRRRPRPPDLADGRADHDRLGDADEQGLRGDRGAPPLRRRRTSGSSVVVHPQSLIHSLIHLNDGSSLAHLGYPDMRVPISYALHYPERADVDVPQLDLATVGSLTFEEPDPETFACLRLALEAGAAGGTAPCVLNAADEVAVAAFLAERIPFTGDPRGDRAGAGGDAGARRSPTSTTSSPPTPRPASAAKSRSGG